MILGWYNMFYLFVSLFCSYVRLTCSWCDVSLNIHICSMIIMIFVWCLNMIIDLLYFVLILAMSLISFHFSPNGWKILFRYANQNKLVTPQMKFWIIPDCFGEFQPKLKFQLVWSHDFVCVCFFIIYIYIYIYVDTKFCALNLILEDDWNDHSKYPKNYKCISCIKLFITYHKNDLEIPTIVTNMSGSQIGPLNWKVSRDQVFTVWMHFIWVKPITCDL